MYCNFDPKEKKKVKKKPCTHKSLFMFSPLLKSCFPYYVSSPAHPVQQHDSTVNDSHLSVANYGATSRDYYNGNRNGWKEEDDIDNCVYNYNSGCDDDVNCGSSSGRRYSPPCEPPPPTPYANLFNVTEIEYAVPFIQRYQFGNGTNDMVVYENGRRINTLASGFAFPSHNGVHPNGYKFQVNYIYFSVYYASIMFPVFNAFFFIKEFETPKVLTAYIGIHFFDFFKVNSFLL